MEEKILSTLTQIQTDISSIKEDVTSIKEDLTSIKEDITSIKEVVSPHLQNGLSVPQLFWAFLIPSVKSKLTEE